MIGWLNHTSANPEYWQIKRSIKNNIISEQMNYPKRWIFVESALFWLRDDVRPTWEQYSSIQTKSVVVEENWSQEWNTIYLWIEYYPNDSWADAPSKEHRWRLRYNDNDDTYLEKYFDSEEIAKQEFEYLTLAKNYNEICKMFKELNFEYW